MTDAQTQLNRLAVKYAGALVDYHISQQDRDAYIRLCNIQDMMDEVAREIAAETGC